MSDSQCPTCEGKDLDCSWEPDQPKPREWPMEIRGEYVPVIEKSAYDRLRTALDRIAILGSGEKAYTSDFTTEVMGIAREALKGNE